MHILVIIFACAFAATLDAAATAPSAPAAVGDFPVWIDLDKPQLVTVVIEDAAGVRVRNLLAETLLPAGKNRLTWDGFDDGQRNSDGDLVRRRVAPGTYRARGLTQDGIKLVYEFTAYSGGNPPWPTKDSTGGWLADHSPPLGAVFLPANSGSPYGDGAPQVLLTALIAECGVPLVWVGLDGQTLQRRQVWGWEGAVAATRDAGQAADPDHYAYLIMGYEKSIAIRGLKKDGSGTDIVSYPLATPGDREPLRTGYSVAVHDGLLAFSVIGDEALVLVDVPTRTIIGRLPMPKPTGLHFDASGRLLVISKGTVLRYRIERPKGSAPQLTERTVLIEKDLENPRTLAFNPLGTELFIADWGRSHQVKVFTPDGKLLRIIGKPNDGTQLGLYDELEMQAPLGLAIDDRNQLWVAEATHLPKRISLWNAQTGAFLRAHYGPPRYGGGGTIDPSDKTRMFYSDYYGLMEFVLDWKTGTAKPFAICVNGFSGGTSVVDKFGIEYGHDKDGGPSRWGFANQRPVHINGRTYLIGSWAPRLRGNDHDTIWMLGDDHVAVPVGRVGGSGFSWPPQLNQNYHAARSKDGNYRQELIAWSDLNGNHKVDKDEYTFRYMPGTYIDVEGNAKDIDGIVAESVFPDLSMTANWGLHVPPPTFNAKGIPIWDLSKAEYILPPTAEFRFDEQNFWGTTVWPLADGWVVSGFNGHRDRKRMWTYPVNDDAPPMRGGDVIHPTRALGVPAKAVSGEAGYWYAINGEKGNMFLMTSDGLFLQTLGGDMRTTPLLRLPKAERGAVIDEPGKHVCFEDEHFGPTITQTAQGEIYMVAGKEHSSIFRVEGFASVKRRVFTDVMLDAAALAKLPDSTTTPRRKKTANLLDVEVGGAEPVVDGLLDEYRAWAAMTGERKATLRIGAKHLYAAWRTGDKDCLDNSGGDYKFLFKRGGCVDIMLQTDVSAKRSGNEPMAGDLRLLLTRVKGEVKAVLYRAVVPGTVADGRVHFVSPVGSVWFDQVVDVSKQVQLVQVDGDVEISIPLATLGLKLALGDEIRGDLGILRGDGTQTIQRLYWSNADTLIVSDIPSEARLQPANWGRFSLVNHHTAVDLRVRLAPEKAKRNSKSMQLKKFEENDYAIGFWDQAADYLEWSDCAVKPGTYDVRLTYGCGNTKSNGFIFSDGKQSLPGKATFTGAWDTYATMSLGRITLTGDKSSFTLKPVTADAGLMDFRQVMLVPVQP